MSTISDAITKDHRELKQYYHEVTNSSDHDHQERFGNQFTWELARHSVAEELIVYPAFEKHMGDKGHQMAESDRKEHHQVSGRRELFSPLSSYLTTNNGGP
jgi:hemerythrin superfamily protein